jgi:hypothetical protein
MFTEDQCEAFFGTTTQPCNRELIVETARDNALVTRLPSFRDGSGRTVFTDPACTPVAQVTDDPNVQRQRLRGCFPQAVPFEVRAAGVWTVVGARAGFRHNVVSVDGVCTAEPGVIPTGRLRQDDGTGTPPIYQSNAFQLRLFAGVARVGAEARPVVQPTARGTTIQFSTTGGFSALSLDVASNPTAVRYFCTDTDFFVVDQGRASLLEFTTAPISTPRTFN